jgi:hypothetical protein
MALENGLPTSFDSEGWSLVATPLEAFEDIPVGKTLVDNDTLFLSQISSSALAKLETNVGEWGDFNAFWTPKDFKINPAWVANVGNATAGATRGAPMFGIGTQIWEDAAVPYGYFYALVLDISGDGDYDSAVIDMHTSAWTTYMEYIWYDGEDTFMPGYTGPDWDFSNDNVVTWSSGVADDFVFAADWNNDGANDWSYGSMANAYNRYGFLTQTNTSGIIVNGVAPDGSGFVALHPNNAGFGDHGTWVSSVAASRGVVNYNVYTNNTYADAWPQGVSDQYKLNGSAPGASILSDAWGASPQDALLAWLWAGGFDLGEITPKVVDLEGSQWTYRGTPRANITSNSWGSSAAARYSGFGVTDFLVDIMSTADFGGEFFQNQFPWALYADNSTDTFTDLSGVDFAAPFEPFGSGDFMYVGGKLPIHSVNVTFVNGTAPNTNAYYWNGSQWLLHANDVFSGVAEGDDAQVVFHNNMTDMVAGNFSSKVEYAYWVAFESSANVNVSDVFVTYHNQFDGYPGMLFVFSSGNDGYYDSTSNAYGTKSLKVGGVNANTLYAPFFGTLVDGHTIYESSSSGPKMIGVPAVDVLAPTKLISAAPLYMAWLNGPDDQQGLALGHGNYSYFAWAGTSASAPGASGIASLVYDAFTDAGGTGYLDPTVVKTILKSSATNLNYQPNIQGAGLLNAVDAVAMATELGTGGPDNSFWFSANDTFENYLDANTRNYVFWNYLQIPGVGDDNVDNLNYPTDALWDITDDTTLYSAPHGDAELSAFNVMTGDWYNTTVQVSGNETGDISVKGVTLEPVAASTKYFTNSTGDIRTTTYFGGGTNTRLFIDLSGNFSTYFGSSSLYDYVEIYIDDSAVPGLIYTDTFYTTGTYAQGVATFNDNGSLVTSVGFLERAWGPVSKMGDTGRFGTDNVFMGIRGSFTNGVNVSVTVQGYNYVDNSAVTTVWDSTTGTANDQDSFFNVSIDTTGMSAGFHHGFLEITSGAVVKHMPMTVKVYDVITANGTAGDSPQEFASFTFIEDNYNEKTGWLNYGSTGNYFASFGVNESDTDHAGHTLVLKAEFEDATANDDLNMELFWDAIPKYRGSQNIFSQEGATADGTVWYYMPWGTTDDSGSPVWYAASAGGTFIYTVALWSDFYDGFNRSVKLSGYWLTSDPDVEFTWTDDSDEEVATGSLIQGPVANVTVSLSVTGDSNIVDKAIYFGELVERDVIDVEGSLPAGSNPGRSVDSIVTADLIGGDQISVYFWIPDGDPVADDIDLAVFAPGHEPAIGDGFGDSIAQFYTDASGGDESICEGIFIAPSTGTYYFGVDTFGTTKDYKGTITPSASAVVNTGESSSFTFNTDNVGPNPYNFTDGDVGLAAEARLGSNLDTDSKVTFTIDNDVVPTAEFSDATLELDREIFNRGDASVTFTWSGADANGDQVHYLVSLSSPVQPAGNPAAFYVRDITATTFTWNFANQDNFPDGRWTFQVTPYDTTEFGGAGAPISIFVNIETTGGNQISTTVINNTVTSTTTASPGFSAMLLLLTMMALVPIIALRKRK